MLTSRQKQMLQEIPKAENHIHIEGSIPWALALELAEKNHVKLPVHSTEEIAVWSQDLISRKGLDGFMICVSMRKTMKQLSWHWQKRISVKILSTKSCIWIIH